MLKESEIRNFIQERTQDSIIQDLGEKVGNGEGLLKDEADILIHILKEELRRVKGEADSWSIPTDFFRFGMHWVCAIDFLQTFKGGTSDVDKTR